MRWAFKLDIFYTLIVILGVFVVLSIGYMELKPYCRNKSVARQIKAAIAPFNCYNSECTKAIYDKLYKEKQQDYCKYVNYGNLL